jgi:DNA-binding NarL/FixJ family response regulator
MNIKRPRVVLVDNYPAILHRILPLMSAEFDVVDVFDDGRALPGMVHKINPDLIVLDITLPGLNGIEIAALLKKTRTSARIVFFTVHADPDYAREAFRTGAMGYVLKPRLASDLIPALKAAMSDRRFVSPCPELAELANGLAGSKLSGDKGI